MRWKIINKINTKSTILTFFRLHILKWLCFNSEFKNAQIAMVMDDGCYTEIGKLDEGSSGHLIKKVTKITDIYLLCEIARLSEFRGVARNGLTICKFLQSCSLQWHAFWDLEGPQCAGGGGLQALAAPRM